MYLSETLTKLKSDLKFRNFFQSQLFEAEWAIAEIIYDLFDPYLNLIRANIPPKMGYELAVEAHCGDEPIGFEEIPIIQLSFSWEPHIIGEEFLCHHVKFTQAQKKMINKYIKEFSTVIETKVKLDT